MPHKIARYGWVHDLPDQRDHLYAAPREFLLNLPVSVDLRPQCPPVYDQGQLGCYDPETEVLTNEGWKHFPEVSMDDEIATLNRKGEIEYHEPLHYFEYDYEGPMVHCSKRGLDFMVTPNHHVYGRKWDQQKRTLSDEPTFIHADKLGWYTGLLRTGKWKGKDQESVVIRNKDDRHLSKRTAYNIPMDDWLWFLGIYIAGGSVNHWDRKKDHYLIEVAAVDSEKRQIIEEHLRKLPWKLFAPRSNDRLRINNRALYEILKPLGQAREKCVPSFVKQLPPSRIEKFLEAYTLGDGHVEPNGCTTFYTSSKRLADDLQELLLKAGKVGNIRKRPRRVATTKGERIVSRVQYELQVKKRQVASIKRKEGDVHTHQYKGKVYCLEVPNHVMYVRRNGTPLWCGNSCTANAIAAALEFDQMKEKQRVFMPSRLFIYYNERAMEGTINEDSGGQIRDGIKSVGQQGDCPEPLWPYDITKFKVKPPEQCYQQALKFKAVQYQRLSQILNQLKGCLASGYPFVFGFTVYASFEGQQVAQTGHASMPPPTEATIGGHAVMAVGYDDSQNWFIVRNSWGAGWGMQGYFTLPYTYLLEHNLASDFWTIRIVS